MNIVDRIFNFIPDKEFEKDFDDERDILYIRDRKDGKEYQIEITDFVK